MKQVVSPAEDRLVKAVARSKARLTRLRKHRPELIKGRQVFCGALVKSAQKVVDRDRFSNWVRFDAVRTHHLKWDAKTKYEKQAWHRLADRVKDAAIAKRRDQIGKDVANLEKLSAELQEKSKKVQSLRISACKLTDAEKVELNDMVESCDWSEKHLVALRERAAKPVVQPSAEHLALLSSMDVGEEVAGVDQPPFLGWMCHHREWFCRSVLRIRRGDASHDHFLFAYAYQNPT